MSTQIETAFVNDYKTVVQHLLQQKDSRFRSCVTHDHYVGEGGKAVEQFAATTAQKRTSRNSDTPNIDVEQDARWVYPVDYEWSKLIDSQDKLRMLIEPTNPLTQAGVMSMMRAYDDEIIAAFFADAKTGKTGATTTPFDTANQQIAAGSTGLTVAKLREAKKKLLEAEVDVEFDPLYIALSAAQHDDLLSETQAISLDYNDRPVLVDGMITRFMGFKFKQSERLYTDGSGNRRLPCWAQSGMHVGTWDEMTIRVTERDDKSYAAQPYIKQTIGATRLEEKKVVEILCAE